MLVICVPVMAALVSSPSAAVTVTVLISEIWKSSPRTLTAVPEEAWINA